MYQWMEQVEGLWELWGVRVGCWVFRFTGPPPAG